MNVFYSALNVLAIKHRTSAPSVSNVTLLVNSFLRSRKRQLNQCIFCEQNTLTRRIFSYLHARLAVSRMTLAQGAVRIGLSMFHVVVRLVSLPLSASHSPQSHSSSSSFS